MQCLAILLVSIQFYSFLFKLSLVVVLRFQQNRNNEDCVTLLECDQVCLFDDGCCFVANKATFAYTRAMPKKSY